jgi:hypothetical protein
VDSQQGSKANVDHRDQVRHALDVGAPIEPCHEWTVRQQWLNELRLSGRELGESAAEQHQDEAGSEGDHRR